MVSARRKTRWTVLLIATWTIIQTVIHVFWVIYAYLLTVCRIRPTHYDIVFVYLTYFFKDSCGSINLKRETLFLNSTVFGEKHVLDENASNVLYHFINETLHVAELPPQSHNLARTEMYLLLLFIIDGVWMVTAVGMLVGEFCNSRQTHLAIIFNGPWLLCSALVIFLDVVSSVQYGLDLIYIQSFTTWLDFVGVANSQAFQPFNEHPSSKVLPLVPTTVVVSLLGRLFFVWLTNVICFFLILFMATPDFYRPGTQSRRSRTRISIDGGTDVNSAETRIRNWQLFYGNIEASSTLTNESSRTVPGSSRSSEAPGQGKTVSITPLDESARSPQKIPLEACISLGDCGFRRFSDVASGVGLTPMQSANRMTGAANANLSALKAQLPWSYLSFEGQFPAKTTKGYPGNMLNGSNNITLTRF